MPNHRGRRRRKETPAALSALLICVLCLCLIGGVRSLKVNLNDLPHIFEAFPLVDEDIDETLADPAEPGEDINSGETRDIGFGPSVMLSLRERPKPHPRALTPKQNDAKQQMLSKLRDHPSTRPDADFAASESASEAAAIESTPSLANLSPQEKRERKRKLQLEQEARELGDVNPPEPADQPAKDPLNPSAFDKKGKLVISDLVSKFRQLPLPEKPPKPSAPTVINGVVMPEQSNNRTNATKGPAASEQQKKDRPAVLSPSPVIPHNASVYERMLAVDPASLPRECPVALCPKKKKCAVAGGVCCRNQRHCCPAGTSCVSIRLSDDKVKKKRLHKQDEHGKETEASALAKKVKSGKEKKLPEPMCIKNTKEDPNDCFVQDCRRDTKCPHPGVPVCCLGGDGRACCKVGYQCAFGNPPKCTKLTTEEAQNQLAEYEQIWEDIRMPRELVPGNNTISATDYMPKVSLTQKAQDSKVKPTKNTQKKSTELLKKVKPRPMRDPHTNKRYPKRKAREMHSAATTRAAQQKEDEEHELINGETSADEDDAGGKRAAPSPPPPSPKAPKAPAASKATGATAARFESAENAEEAAAFAARWQAESESSFAGDSSLAPPSAESSESAANDDDSMTGPTVAQQKEADQAMEQSALSSPRPSVSTDDGPSEGAFEASEAAFRTVISGGGVKNSDSFPAGIQSGNSAEMGDSPQSSELMIQTSNARLALLELGLNEASEEEMTASQQEQSDETAALLRTKVSPASEESTQDDQADKDVFSSPDPNQDDEDSSKMLQQSLNELESAETDEDESLTDESGDGESSTSNNELLEDVDQDVSSEELESAANQLEETAPAEYSNAQSATLDDGADETAELSEDDESQDADSSPKYAASHIRHIRFSAVSGDAAPAGGIGAPGADTPPVAPAPPAITARSDPRAFWAVRDQVLQENGGKLSPEALRQLVQAALNGKIQPAPDASAGAAKVAAMKKEAEAKKKAKEKKEADDKKEMKKKRKEQDARDAQILKFRSPAQVAKDKKKKLQKKLKELEKQYKKGKITKQQYENEKKRLLAEDKPPAKHSKKKLTAKQRAEAKKKRAKATAEGLAEEKRKMEDGLVYLFKNAHDGDSVVPPVKLKPGFNLSVVHGAYVCAEGLCIDRPNIQAAGAECKAQLRFGTGPFTFTARFKTPAQGLWKRLITIRDLPGKKKRWYSLAITNNRPIFEWGAGAPNRIYGSKTVNDDEWHTVSVVRDSHSKQITMFIDGAKNVEAEYKGDSWDNDGPLQIGFWSNEAKQGSAFFGEIELISLTNRQKRMDEIRDSQSPDAPAVGARQRHHKIELRKRAAQKAKRHAAALKKRLAKAAAAHKKLIKDKLKYAKHLRDKLAKKILNDKIKASSKDVKLKIKKARKDPRIKPVTKQKLMAWQAFGLNESFIYVEAPQAPALVRNLSEANFLPQHTGFTMVTGNNKKEEGSVSFRSNINPRAFLRHRHSQIILDVDDPTQHGSKKDNTQTFNGETSFRPIKGIAGDHTFTFELETDKGPMLIRRIGNKLVAQPFKKGDKAFAAESSWLQVALPKPKPKEDAPPSAVGDGEHEGPK